MVLFDMLVAAFNNVTHAAPGATPVRVDGWTISSGFLAIITGLLLPVLYAVLKFLPVMRNLKDRADGSLRSDLLARLAKVEADAAASLSANNTARREFDIAMNDQRRAFDDALNTERRECSRQLGAYQRKMEAVTRQFFQFQLSLVRYLPAEAGPTAQSSVDRILALISQPVEDFEEVDAD